jgi:hypothetical protein
MSGDDRIERTARLIEKLLAEPELRREFRARPENVLEANGLGELASEGEKGRPFHTLDLRESRSSLAGVLAAAAAEGAGLLELIESAERRPQSQGARAVRRAMTRTGMKMAEVGRRTAADPVDAGPPAKPERELAVPARAHVVDRLLANDRLVLPDAAREDLRVGVDPRIPAVLERLLATHRIEISVIQSGHDRFVAGTNVVSNHAVGRGFDISAVDGRPVSPDNAAAKAVADQLLALPDDLGPHELGSPWQLEADAAFTDAAHQDHLHVAWDTPSPKRSWPSPGGAEADARKPVRVAPSSHSGAIRRPDDLRSGAHRVRATPTVTRAGDTVEPAPPHAAGIRTPFAAEIDAAAARHGVDPHLLRGLIRAESNFDPNARSPAGAIGLCQLMPGTAAGLGVDPTDPRQNLDGGAKLLAYLLRKYDADVRLALAAYNAGEGNVDEHGGVPPFEETQEYIPRVLGYAREYREKAPGTAASAREPEAAPARGREPVRNRHGTPSDLRSGAVVRARASAMRSGAHAVVEADGLTARKAQVPVGERMVAIAAREIGEREVTEDESPRIAFYRRATDGSMPSQPWCAYFVSWVARRAGHPLGDEGQGYGGVAQVWAWASGQGTAELPGGGYTPRPGDLILFGGNNDHIGIVEKVLSDGRIQTLEGNYSDQVARVLRAPSEASGFVRMG